MKKRLAEILFNLAIKLHPSNKNIYRFMANVITEGAISGKTVICISPVDVVDGVSVH